MLGTFTFLLVCYTNTTGSLRPSFFTRTQDLGFPASFCGQRINASIFMEMPVVGVRPGGKGLLRVPEICQAFNLPHKEFHPHNSTLESMLQLFVCFFKGENS